MGESRQALIIAVSKYELSDEFDDLTDTVGHDIELMTGALASSGYSVELIGDTPEEPAQGPRIRSAVSRVCATAPEDGTVLIHFTGHGLSIAGADYLVPADAQLTWATTPPQVDVDSLIGLDLAKLLRGSRAGTVLITVDACRDETGTASYGGPATNFPAGRDRIAVLFGCGPGQTCGSDETEGSHFTRALAEALHADTSPRTAAEVIAHTVRRTTEIARQSREVQTPTPHYAPSGPAAIEDVLLCAGRTLQEDWALAVRDPELWAAVSGDDEQRRSAIHSALDDLTSACARWCANGGAGFADPWADDDYPVRVLRKGLRPLLAPSQTQGGLLLDVGEFAALAAAPFVREAVYAMGVREASAADPLQLQPADGDAARHPERVDLEHTFAAHALLWRKGRELAGRGRLEEATAVAAWLLRRHVSAKEELWDTYAPQLLAPLAGVLAGGDAPPARVGELTDELVHICRQTAVAPMPQYEGEREPLDNRWRLDELELQDATVERWRPRELSWLLGVAGLLGGDLRLLPGVLVDNIGITDGLVPAAAVESVRRLRWNRDRLTKALDLALDCPHPAVHAALETLAAWTDEAVQNIRRQLAPDRRTDLLTHLPVRVTCRKLRPQYDVRTKGRAYGMPLMRFSLAEDEMRELLMGNRLYGDRALALRELYQNALDACRYRQARLRYGEASQGIPHHWNGQIVFRQGTDAEGRTYIECEDNGVGMGHETLRGTFARAGRRFEQSRAYRREQARWRRADPALRIYPNSRFGIGVFSYFMLADEISIWTRATDQYGRAELDEGLRVDIASSGSLFRIRGSEEAQPEAGTRVRLYLQGDAEVDVAAELGKLVWRSEFAMRVEDGGQVVRDWEPKALYYFGDHLRPVPAGPDIWWVEGQGCLLADGVLVNAETVSGESGGRDARAWLDEELRRFDPVVHGDWHARGGRPFGVVVDLRESHAPDISTNRNDLLSYDRFWIDSAIEAAGKTFTAPSWLTLEWLWAFARRHSTAVVGIVTRLLAADVRIATRCAWQRDGTVEFRKIGCLQPDPELAVLHRERRRTRIRMRWLDSDDPSALETWRTGVLRSQGIELGGGTSDLPLPESLSGYPDAEAWEAGAGPRHFDFFAALVGAAVSEPEEGALTLGEVFRRLRRYAITGLALPPCRDPDAAHRMALDDVDRRTLGGHHYLGGLLALVAHATPSAVSTLQLFTPDEGMPVAEVLGRARRFAAVGLPLVVPEPVAQPSADLVLHQKHVRMLARHPQLCGPERQPMRRSDAVLYEETLRRHSWFGLPPDRVPEDRILPDEHESSEPDPASIQPPDCFDSTDDMRECFGLPRVTETRSLTCRQLARASGLLSVPVAELVRRCRHVFDAWKLRLPDYGALADRTFTRLDSDLLGAMLPNSDVLGADAGRAVAPLIETAAAVRGMDDTPTESVVERLGVLAGLGLVREEAPRLAERWRALSEEDWNLATTGHRVEAFRSRRPGLGFVRVNVEGSVDERSLLVLAASAGMTLGAARHRMLELGPLLGLDVSPLEPAVDPVLADVQPEPLDLAACLDFHAKNPVWRSPSLSALTRHAYAGDHTLEESLTVLSRYAAFGALWRLPEEPTEQDRWCSHRPDVHDIAMFKPDLAGEGPVGPMELLRVAARFGWRIDRAWDRLARYRPLGLAVEVARPDVSTVPAWYDLILLSEHYTGDAPALSGAVTADRIAVTARELELPTHRIHERLRLYAAIFGLEVPESYPAEPAPTPAGEYYTPPVPARVPD